jgi:hypothetical protein
MEKDDTGVCINESSQTVKISRLDEVTREPIEEVVMTFDEIINLADFLMSLPQRKMP